jgi:hypothetical protein
MWREGIPFDEWDSRLAWEQRYHFTCGDFGDEVSAQRHIVDLLRSSGDFAVYEQVRGHLLQPRAGQTDKTMRIDVIVSPRQHLIDLGWSYGSIGIEVKRSGEKINAALAQMIDYSRSVFRLPDGNMVCPSFVLLWPWYGPGGGVLESIVAQQRLGAVVPELHGVSLTSRIDFAVVNWLGTTLTNDLSAQGRKTGSR